MLVVDEAPTHAIVSVICRKLGLGNVDTAEDGAEALAMLRAQTYAIVVSDWHMKPMTGFDLLRTVRGDANLVRTRFPLMTVQADAAAVLAAKRFGVDSYIIKPLAPKVLQERLLAILN